MKGARSSHLKTISVTLGHNVKSLRKKSQMSLKELADQCKMERATLCRMEKGHSNATLNTLLKLSLALGVSICNLITPPST